MRLTEITDFEAPELDVYARLTEAQLLNRFEPKKGMFIAESIFFITILSFPKQFVFIP